MTFIKIENIPEFVFAHSYDVENYENILGCYDNRIEISYITKGALKCETDGKVFLCKENDIIANTFSSPLKISSKGFHSHHTVCFELSFTLSDIKKEGFYELPLLTPSGEESGKILSVIDDIIRKSTINPGKRLAESGLFLQLVSAIDELNKIKRSAVRYSDLQYVEKAKKYIFDNLNHSIEQKEIARHLKITPEYLCAVFKNAEGVSVMTFINRIKLEKIVTLMKKENLKLYQAAELYGYNDPNYVSRLYKKYFGKSISESLNDY